MKGKLRMAVPVLVERFERRQFPGDERGDLLASRRSRGPRRERTGEPKCQGEREKVER